MADVAIEPTRFVTWRIRGAGVDKNSASIMMRLAAQLFPSIFTTAVLAFAQQGSVYLGEARDSDPDGDWEGDDGTAEQVPQSPGFQVGVLPGQQKPLGKLFLCKLNDWVQLDREARVADQSLYATSEEGYLDSLAFICKRKSNRFHASASRIATPIVSMPNSSIRKPLTSVPKTITPKRPKQQ